jgi:hypothetical protein
MKRITLAGVCLLAVALPRVAAAQDTTSDRWNFTVAPYLMGANMNGTLGIAAREATIDASSHDIFSHLQFGAMGMVAARKGKWGVGGDFIWMALGTTTETPPANIDPNQGAFAFYGLRRLSPDAELTFGARWNELQSRIGFKGPAETTLEQTQRWVDPLVGLNFRTSNQGHLHAHVYSEIGGFGAGSRLEWQVFPTLAIDLAKVMSLDVGYRWLYMDYHTGDGPTYFKYDVMTRGPVAGFTFRF